MVIERAVALLAFSLRVSCIKVIWNMVLGINSFLMRGVPVPPDRILCS